VLESLPEEQRQKIQAMFGTPITAKVDKTIVDGEVLPYCGGITVIFTPGHTPGRVSPSEVRRFATMVACIKKRRMKDLQGWLIPSNYD
jgi:hypothetical protein